MYPLMRVALMWRLTEYVARYTIPPLGLDVPVSTHQSEDFSGVDTSCSFQMSTPTTQAVGTPAASAAANTIVASSATTGSSLSSTPVVTSTVTTPSSPERTMSLGDYKQMRGIMVLARDELEALFDVGSDADMEDGEEEDEGTSSSTRVDPSVGSRRPRDDDSGGDSTSSNTVVSRTGPVRDPWMPTPSEIQSRFGSTAPPSQYALYSCSGINDDDVTKEPTLIQRRIKDAITTSDSFMSSDGTGIRSLPVEAECPNGRHSVKAGVLLLKTSTKTPLATVSVFA
ncbi:unnamed protein product [Phytophthora fragariaefolia]|uniref:Unnamed protein product n=1 Tax=Phytophthora fragariaefolia TaxID=1490495 RepID=A0A9W6YRH3_9STRA|nr:unnamed protein product [Phytophthora fragariaefolia]